MKLLLPLLTSLLVPVVMLAETIEVSGPVHGSWSTDTVKVVGDLIVPAGNELIIEPGTVILFTGHFLFEVKGNILASGTETDSILFSVQDTTGFSDTLVSHGGWRGFFYEHLMASADSSVFRYCVFEYGKAVLGDSINWFGGAFRIFNYDKVEFDHCTFRNNLAYRWGGAVYLKNADAGFHHCHFRDNRCGQATFPYGYGGGICSVSSSPLVMHCTFENNASTGVGGGASFEYSDPLLTHNDFHSNRSGLGGALAFLRSSPHRVVSNNLVHGNEAVFFGGGICVIANSTVFSNMTLTGNTSIYGGGLYCNDSAVPAFYNTIIHGNFSYGPGAEIYIWDVRSAPDFHYCNIRYGTDSIAGSGGMQGYHGHWENNMDTIPGFSNQPLQPLSLMAGSAMINAGDPDTTGLQVPGSDFYGSTRFYDGRIDIGASEFRFPDGLPEQDVTDFSLSPNPSGGTVFLKTNKYKGEANISMTDLQGRIIRSETIMISDAPVYLDLGRTEGHFILIIKTDSKTYSKKIRIIQ